LICFRINFEDPYRLIPLRWSKRLHQTRAERIDTYRYISIMRDSWLDIWTIRIEKRADLNQNRCDSDMDRDIITWHTRVDAHARRRRIKNSRAIRDLLVPCSFFFLTGLLRRRDARETWISCHDRKITPLHHVNCSFCDGILWTKRSIWIVVLHFARSDPRMIRGISPGFERAVEWNMFSAWKAQCYRARVTKPAGGRFYAGRRHAKNQSEHQRATIVQNDSGERA